MILQLDPPIPLRTPKGDGLAVLVIDYGPDHDLLWTVILGTGDHAGEVWTYRNPEVRGVDNLTLGRQPPPRADEWREVPAGELLKRNMAAMDARDEEREKCIRLVCEDCRFGVPFRAGYHHHDGGQTKTCDAFALRSGNG